MSHLKYDLEAIKAALPFPEIFKLICGEMRPETGHFVACCPVHSEKSASYHIYADHGHCFGCGEHHGSIFDLFLQIKDLTFPESVAELAALANIQGQEMEENEWKARNKIQNVPAPVIKEKPRTRPIIPPLRAMTTDEVLQLATLRGLDPLAVRCAARDFKRVAFCAWPQWQRGNVWDDGRAVPSYVVTDSARWVYQFRRLDGANYRSKNGDCKCLSKGSPKWPLGASEIGDRAAVMICEGGTDMLAAYHFLWGFDLLDKVAVVAILGSSNRIADDALEFFRGKRVRIMADADRAKPGIKAKKLGNDAPLDQPFGPYGLPVIPQGWKVPSLDAAQRWTKQLTAAGAAVETFSLYGLSRANGEPVSDLNDLALADAETLNSEDVRDAFFEWDF